jgi:glycosyltransferase involved in cell wall biosynthesis
MEVPDARFTIMGFQPGPEMAALDRVEGITVIPNVPDVRGPAQRHSAVVLPLVSGGGMKNKLLEAAALGIPIVCTTLATQGLQGLSEAPLVVADSAVPFARGLIDLWREGDRRQRIAADTRAWVVRHHDWKATAHRAIATLEGSRKTA